MSDLSSREVDELKDTLLDAQMDNEDPIEIEKARYLPSRETIETTVQEQQSEDETQNASSKDTHTKVSPN